MKRFRLFVIAFCCTLLVTSAFAARTLSPNAEISLMTCSKGSELYTSFGHSAFRVYDAENGLNHIYNYGVFSFDTPNFYPKFLRGKLNYRLTREQFNRFKRAYVNDNRAIYQQNLNFTIEQKQALYDYLEHNLLPENRYYLYDFFFDNCATRLRDAVQNVLGDSLSFNDSFLKEDYSFRDLVDQCLIINTWPDFGVNLILGSVIDRKATPAETMFLPTYLSDAFAVATMQQNGRAVPLCQPKETVIERKMMADETNGLLLPKGLLWLVFGGVLVLTMVQFLGTSTAKGLYFDALLFTVLGLIGLVMALMWLATDHRACAVNWNVLWAFPTHLLVGGLLLRWQKYKWLRYYWLLTAVVSGGVLLLYVVGAGVQVLHPAFIPLILLVLIRSIYVYYQYLTSNN